jgi:hypothetical protein
VDSPIATFQYFTGLKSAGGRNVTDIGNYAFYECYALETVYFPEATTIGESAFEDCTSLTSVDFPEATTIGDFAFTNCSALVLVQEKPDFPKATSIGSHAFYYCGALKAIYFPEVTSIGDDAFYSCDALEVTTFPEVTTIGNEAFSGCTSLGAVYFPEVTTIGDFAFSYTGSTTLTVYLGNTAPVLGVNLFYSNAYDSKLVTVRVPSGATGYDLPFDYSDTYTYNWGNAFRGIGWDGESYLDGEVNLYITLYVDVEESNESLTP